MPTSLALELAERGWLPDTALRWGIRRLCGQRLRKCERGAGLEAFVAASRRAPIAPLPELANAQHYEVPAEFFRLVLGPRLKYSCCLWDERSPLDTLADAEVRSLQTTCDHADVRDGQEILELGCGWGSLSLWMAERFPAARITAVSNSRPQREFILARAAERGVDNLRVVTADINDFAPAGRFDRVVSVEMFEHLRNYGRMLERIAGWLRPAGRLFVHIFCHRRFAYPFEIDGGADWMARHFFSGGTMPAANLLEQYAEALRVERQWNWSGEHYRRTAEAWLRNLDASRVEVERLFAAEHGHHEARRQLQRWRMFFLAVAELFGYRGGQEWQVMHYLLSP